MDDWTRLHVQTRLERGGYTDATLVAESGVADATLVAFEAKRDGSTGWSPSGSSGSTTAS